MRIEENEEKLRRAGADRIVNPQSIGGARASAAFLLQPHVTEFLDVVMRDRGIEFRLEEVAVPPDSSLAGQASAGPRTFAPKPAPWYSRCESPDGSFVTNPAPDQLLARGQVLIAIGTKAELGALEVLAAGTDP